MGQLRAFSASFYSHGEIQRGQCSACFIFTIIVSSAILDIKFLWGFENFLSDGRTNPYGGEEFPAKSIYCLITYYFSTLLAQDMLILHPFSVFLFS